jgi:hypothetical protein
MYRKNRKFKINSLIIISIISTIFFISVGYAILTGKLNINFKATAKISSSSARWNVTDSWVGKKNLYYYGIIIKIDNKEGPVLENEREISFKIPTDFVSSESNIWVAENYRIDQERLYINCYSWLLIVSQLLYSFN